MRPLIATCVLLSACAGTPTTTAPTSVAEKPPAVLAAVVIPEPAAAVGDASWVTTGSYPCGARPAGTYRWTVSVADAGPQGIRVVTLVHHDKTSGCAPTVAGPRDAFQVAGMWKYAAHESGTAELTYDTREHDCGRAQVDASFLGEDGREWLLVGEVVDYGRNCAEAPKPPPVVPPTTEPPPTDPPLVRCVPNVNVVNARMVAVGNDAVVTFTVVPGVRVDVSVRSFRKLPSGVKVPQTFYAGSEHTVGPGTHTLSVPLSPTGPVQGDLFCGRLPREDLTQEAYERYKPLFVTAVVR